MTIYCKIVFPLFIQFCNIKVNTIYIKVWPYSYPLYILALFAIALQCNNYEPPATNSNFIFSPRSFTPNKHCVIWCCSCFYTFQYQTFSSNVFCYLGLLLPLVSKAKTCIFFMCVLRLYLV